MTNVDSQLMRLKAWVWFLRAAQSLRNLEIARGVVARERREFVEAQFALQVGTLVTFDDTSLKCVAHDGLWLSSQLNALLETVGAGRSCVKYERPLQFAVGRKFIDGEDKTYTFPEGFRLERDDRMVVVADSSLRVSFKRDANTKRWRFIRVIKLGKSLGERGVRHMPGIPRMSPL